MAVVVSNWTDKWCPNAIVAPHSANRASDGQPLDGTMCMGEGCIAWQWEEEAKQIGWCRAFGPVAPFIQREPKEEQ